MPETASVRKAKEQIRRELRSKPEIKQAEKEAELIYEKANELVKEGKWVPLNIESPREAHSEYVQGGTSIITYYGPEGLLKTQPTDERTINYTGKPYNQIKNSSAESLFKKGLIGKTHELIIGSAYYPMWRCRCGCHNLYDRATEREQCKRCKSHIPDALVKSKEQKSPSTPLAGRVKERHWEIYQMWRNMKKKNTINWFLRL